MTDNIYAPPEAELSKPSDKGEPYVRGFDRVMITAIILLVIASTLMTGLMYISSPEEFVLRDELVGAVLNIGLTVVIVYFIKRLRVRGLGTALESAGKALGVWGYFWRGFITQFAAVLLMMIPFLILLFLTNEDFTEALSSLLGTIVLGIVLFPLSIFCVWASYSKDRSGQLSGFFSMFHKN